LTLRSRDGKNWSLVLETIDAREPQAISFRLAGGLATTPVHVWETNGTHVFEHVASVEPVQGSFRYSFSPESLFTLTTTTGQGKGDAQPPPAAAFPFPYADDFEQTPLHHAPRYLSDQDGAFEVRPCVDRTGQCLEQLVSMRPVPWAAAPTPFTIAGDAAWSDYMVAADVRFLSAAPALLMGRIDSADVFQDEGASYPSAFVLRLNPDGAWVLLSTAFKMPDTVLASGNAPLDASQWHRLALRFRAQRIEATLDGNALASVDSAAHAHGMAALGTGWDRIQFDNFRVGP
jgi:hypothetical protein